MGLRTPLTEEMYGRPRFPGLGPSGSPVPSLAALGLESREPCALHVGGHRLEEGLDVLPSGREEPGEEAEGCLLCQAPGPPACCSPAVSSLRSPSGDRDAECPQESAPCTPAPRPWWGPASSPEPSSPESESRGHGPRPSPVSSSSWEGSPQHQGCHPSSAFHTWTLDASRLALLETQVAQPRSSETEEAPEAPDPGEEVKREGPAGTAHAGAVQPDAHLASTGG